LEALVMEFQDCFRLQLGRDPPVNIEPLEVRVKEGAEPVKCKARRYSPEQQAFLKEHIGKLEEAGLVYKNKKSRWSSPPLVVKKAGGGFRMTVDVRAVNDRTERLVWPMPMQESILGLLRGSEYFFSLDFFKGYWQLPLSKESQEIFSFIVDSAVYTPTRVLMGGSDSVAYCQSSVQEMFEELVYNGLLI
jgi:DNA-binding transcriptional ArsR family regulator